MRWIASLYIFLWMFICSCTCCELYMLVQTLVSFLSTFKNTAHKSVFRTDSELSERRTHPSKWEGTQTHRRERHAHRWHSMVKGAMLAQPTRRATYRRALGSGELIPQKERKLRRSEGSGMLIGDPLGEGSSASSTNEELWRAENSFLRVRELRCPEGSGMLIGDPLWWGEQC